MNEADMSNKKLLIDLVGTMHVTLTKRELVLFERADELVAGERGEAEDEVLSRLTSAQYAEAVNINNIDGPVDDD